VIVTLSLRLPIRWGHGTGDRECREQARDERCGEERSGCGP
jgi:hypothetical protein